MSNFHQNNKEDNNLDANAASQRENPPSNGDHRILAPRTLHCCPQPWRVGGRNGPIQLCTTSSIQPHHRTILAILNRITDTNLAITIKRGTELLHPQSMDPASPSLAVLRQDLVSMLFEKAPDEPIYIKDYAMFLRGVSSNIANLPPVQMEQVSRPPGYTELLLPIEELVRLECVKKFETLYEDLKIMYSQIRPWNSEKEIAIRAKLVTHLRFVILLHSKSMFPWDELVSVRETFARPLEIVASLPFNQHHPMSLANVQGWLLHDMNRLESIAGVNIYALAAELLAVFLYHLGHLNLADRDGTKERSLELCTMLERLSPRLCTRQRYVVMRTLELKANGWRHSESSDLIMESQDI